MPVNFHKSGDDFQLGIWRMDETLDELHGMLLLPANDLQTLHEFKSEYRQREWLTTRVLVKQMLNTKVMSIAYDANGKPRLVNSDHAISISHTKNFVAVLLSKQSSPGIDLETIQTRIEKIANRFVSEQEESFIEQDKKIIYHHIIWGTKETLFKIHGQGGLNFLDHLHVEKFQLQEKGQLTARIEKDNYQKNFTVYYEKLDDLMLVYSMS